jgi:hypothetical protein
MMVKRNLSKQKPSQWMIERSKGSLESQPNVRCSCGFENTCGVRMGDKWSAGSEAQSVERETLRRQRSAAARKPRSRRSRDHKGHLSCSQMYGAAVDSKVFAVRIRVEGSTDSEAERIEMNYIQAESIGAGNLDAESLEALMQFRVRVVSLIRGCRAGLKSKSLISISRRAE